MMTSRYESTTNTEKSSLECLPFEIFDIIMDHICQDMSTAPQTLAALCLTSHSVGRFAEARLYHTIDLSGILSSTLKKQQASWMREQRSPFLLLRSILIRPELAHNIVIVRWKSSIPPAHFDEMMRPLYDPYVKVPIDFNGRERTALVSLLMRANMLNKGWWEWKPFSGNPSAAFALLLSQLDQLRTLELHFYHSVSLMLGTVGKVIEHCLSLDPDKFPAGSGFKSLKNIKYSVQRHDPRRSETPVYGGQLKQLLLMPSVEELWLSLHKHEQPLHRVVNPMPSMPALTSLTLETFDVESLGYLLTGCTQLERLDITVDTDVTKGKLRLADFRTALEPVKETLEKLRISTHFWIPWGRSKQNEFVGTLGSFKDFTKLTVLESTLGHLLDLENAPASALAAVLPPYLRELRICHDITGGEGPSVIKVGELDIRILLDLLDAKETIAPSLQKIVLVDLTFKKEDTALIGTHGERVQWEEFCSKEGAGERLSRKFVWILSLGADV